MKNFAIYLVTGATGFLGRVIINFLVKLGKKVKALVLPNDQNISTLPGSVEISYGDVTNKKTLASFFYGDLSNACVIHCAGIISIETKRNKLMEKVNVLGTQNIVDLCLAKQVKRLVYVSSVHAIKENNHQIIKDVKYFSSKNVRGQYAKSKAMASAIVLEACKKGLDASIVLPSGIIGPEDPTMGNVTSIITRFCNNQLKIACQGGYDFVDVRDVADGIIKCARSGKKGECYILSNDYYKIEDILNYLVELGYAKKPRYLPLWFLKIISPFTELRTLLRKQKPFLTPYSVDVLNTKTKFSHDKATKDLKYQTRSFKNTLNDMVEWLQKEKKIGLAK